ncbi:hypothetical protein [Bacillus mycoides]|uniref:hypothetical protein n=1 Tax=Bacillus mycoides TaxID=1405 RepID=UPI003D1D55BA
MKLKVMKLINEEETIKKLEKEFDIDENYVIPEPDDVVFLENKLLFEETLASFDLPGVTIRGGWPPKIETYTIRHKISAKVFYPETLEDAARNIVKGCFEKAVLVAAATLGGLAFTPGAFGAAVPAALAAFGNTFNTCITEAGILETLDIDVKYETKKR